MSCLAVVAFGAILLSLASPGFSEITVEPLRCYHCAENENCNENLGIASPCRSVYDRCATFYDSATAVGVKGRGCIKDTLSGCYSKDDGGKYCVCHTSYCNNYRIGILKIRAHKTDLLVGPSTAISFDVIEKPEGWEPGQTDVSVGQSDVFSAESGEVADLAAKTATDGEMLQMSAGSQQAYYEGDVSDSSGLFKETTLFQTQPELLDKYRQGVPGKTKIIPLGPEQMKGDSYPPNEKIVNLGERPVFTSVTEVMRRGCQILASGASYPTCKFHLLLVAMLIFIV